MEVYKDSVKKNKELEELDESILMLSEISLMARPREIGKLGGKVLKKSQVRRLRGELKKRNGLLILEEDLNIKRIINQYKGIKLNGYEFDNVQDLFYFMKKNNFAGAYDSRTNQMLLGENATELVAFHEMSHLKHFEELGEPYHLLPSWEKETYVWEQVWSRRRDWTEKELEISFDYVNRTRARSGIEPIKNKL